MTDIQEAVESAKKAQARALVKINAEIEMLEEQLISLLQMPKEDRKAQSVNLEHELDDLSGLLRAARFLRLSI